MSDGRQPTAALDLQITHAAQRPPLPVATYPTEFVKTRAQFAVASGAKPPKPMEIVKTTVSQYGVRGLYSGCSALVVGNAAKAGVRFLSYDSIKLAVADREVKSNDPMEALATLHLDLPPLLPLLY